MVPVKRPAPSGLQGTKPMPSSSQRARTPSCGPRHNSEYSDVLVKGPETLAVGRLVLDPYSATLYSSSPGVFAQIESLVRAGQPVMRASTAGAIGVSHAARAIGRWEIVD